MPTLDGYSLPAASGRTGYEQPIDAAGKVIGGPDNGKPVAFAALASTQQQAFRDYYITMRWTYAAWNWNGTANITDKSELSWIQQKPRLVLVTNPKTGKSIIADILESGPAPWTGVDPGPDNVPKQGWVNPQQGTPAGYLGRVSGFPPMAIQALGNPDMGWTDKNGQVHGDVLTYSWAPDQTAIPGPTTLQATATQGSSTSASTPAGISSVCSGSGESVSGVIFVSQNDPRWKNTTAWCGSMGNCGCVLSTESMIISSFTGRFVSPVDLDRAYRSNNDPYNHYGLKATGMWDAGLRPKMPATPANLQLVINALQHGALVAVYAFWDSQNPFWGTDGHEELIYGIAPNGNFLVYDPWERPDPSNPTKPAPGDRHSTQSWPVSNFLHGSNMGFDIVTKG